MSVVKVKDAQRIILSGNMRNNKLFIFKDLLWDYLGIGKRK